MFFRYLLLYEDLLRVIDCRVTIPYWNWARHSKHIWLVLPNYPMWSSFGGFGGTGDPNKGFCVTDGPFNMEEYRVAIPLLNVTDREYFGHRNCEKYVDEGLRCKSLDRIYTSYDFKKKYTLCKEIYFDERYSFCLRRNFLWKPASLKNVQNVIKMTDINDWDNFANIIMFHFHDRIHLIVGKKY